MNDYYKGLSDYNNYRYDLIKSLGILDRGSAGYKEVVSQLGYDPQARSGLASQTWQGVGSTLQGIGGLASAYMGYKQYGLAKDAFKFNKGLANRNLATQGQLINQQMLRDAEIGAKASGLSDPARQALLEEVKSKYVDTTPIK